MRVRVVRVAEDRDVRPRVGHVVRDDAGDVADHEVGCLDAVARHETVTRQQALELAAEEEVDADQQHGRHARRYTTRRHDRASGAPLDHTHGVSLAEGLELMRRERWFDAHEELEAAWRVADRGGARLLPGSRPRHGRVAPCRRRERARRGRPAAEGADAPGALPPEPSRRRRRSRPRPGGGCGGADRGRPARSPAGADLTCPAQVLAYGGARLRARREPLTEHSRTGAEAGSTEWIRAVIPRLRRGQTPEERPPAGALGTEHALAPNRTQQQDRASSVTCGMTRSRGRRSRPSANQRSPPHHATFRDLPHAWRSRAPGIPAHESTRWMRACGTRRGGAARPSATQRSHRTRELQGSAPRPAQPDPGIPARESPRGGFPPAGYKDSPSHSRRRLR